jgi:hypothetical protein
MLRTTRRRGRSKWMDVAGAKALKQRLGPNGVDDAAPAAEVAVEVPVDAPPVYHWTGVSKPASAAPPRVDDEPEVAAVSLFSRLGLSVR